MADPGVVIFCIMPAVSVSNGSVFKVPPKNNHWVITWDLARAIFKLVSSFEIVVPIIVNLLLPQDSGFLWLPGLSHMRNASCEVQVSPFLTSAAGSYFHLLCRAPDVFPVCTLLTAAASTF